MRMKAGRAQRRESSVGGGATSGPRGRRSAAARCGGAGGALVAPTPHCWGAVSPGLAGLGDVRPTELSGAGGHGLGCNLRRRIR